MPIDVTRPIIQPCSGMVRQFCDLPNCLEQARVEVFVCEEWGQLCPHHAELLADRLQDLLRTLPDAR